MHLEGKSLGYRYDENNPWLFKGFDISLQPGEVVGLTGPSGCGKTTLARVLAGYEVPNEGQVTLGDLPVPKHGYHPVQLVLQHPEKAVNPRWRAKRILEESGPLDASMLEALSIERTWLTRWPGELSGGELQRICVARALGPGTRFIIADEMTTMLDAITQAQLWQAVLDISRKRNIGILVISHEMKLIQRLCSRIIHWPSSSI
ncbi:ABC transporter ATP-binding protein [Paenibacillus hamazuiensis]|uniref:ABC transporter ATP-binding protein n=1 Tax=Paenibacillus hamazuiensis TaxID=2936508 RepID=UPI00200D1EA6|nr:ATP-binding cassette domain-containing protein [Paenibacillus hamazuiensis]